MRERTKSNMTLKIYFFKETENGIVKSNVEGEMLKSSD